MKDNPFYIIGNWKSNKSVAQAIDWIKEFALLWSKQPVNNAKVKIILCPGYIHLTTLNSLIDETRIPLYLGLQDVSAYGSGTYTGAISSQMAKGLVSYVLVGHSERRRHFHETVKDFMLKVQQAHAVDLPVIYCVQDEQEAIPADCQIVAYEPVWAISSGDPYAGKSNRPENANRIAALIKKANPGVKSVIYGGSVIPDNVAGYAQTEHINGVLPGGASLDARTFFQLITNASQI